MENLSSGIRAWRSNENENLYDRSQDGCRSRRFINWKWKMDLFSSFNGGDWNAVVKRSYAKYRIHKIICRQTLQWNKILMPNVNRLPKKIQSVEKTILLRHSDGCDCIRIMHTNIKRNVMWKPVCDAQHLRILFCIGDTLLPDFFPFLSHSHWLHVAACGMP